MASLPPPLAEQSKAAAAILGMGAAIAALAPWGLPVAGAEALAPIVRAVLLVCLGVIGLRCARQCGLRLAAKGPGAGARIAGIAAAVAAYLLLLDGLLFRSALPPDYRAMLGQGLAVRVAYFALRAFSEGVFYQLFLGSAFAALLSWRWRSGAAIFSGLVLAHLCNLGLNLPLVPGELVYDALRFAAPGGGLELRLLALGVGHAQFGEPLVSIQTDP